MAIKWTISKNDAELLEMCLDRLYAGNAKELVENQRLTKSMDLNACHSNGCPLDFQKLLDFPDFDFFHDIVGISDHINRKTGKLERCFIPRCARRKHASI